MNPNELQKLRDIIDERMLERYYGETTLIDDLLDAAIAINKKIDEAMKMLENL